MKRFRARFLESGAVRYLLGAIVGFLVGMITVVIGAITIDPTALSINQLVQALVTILVGTFVAMLIQRLVHSDRLEKDFLMAMLGNLSELSNQLRELDHDKTSITEYAALFKQMAVRANSIRDVISTLCRPGLVTDDFDFVAEIQDLKDTATNTPIADIKQLADRTKAKPELKSVITKLTEKQREEIVAKANALCARIVRAQTCVIRA